MTKSHMKRVSAPKTWDVLRKTSKFITKPNPGIWCEEMSIPLDALLKETLGVAKTTKEVKQILNKKLVSIDGKIRNDYKYPVGFMSVATLGESNSSFRLLLSKTGVLFAQPIDKKEANIKLIKIADKKVLGREKFQLNFEDGTNILVKKPGDYKTGNVLVVEIPKNEIKKQLPLTEGARILITAGKHIGHVGTLKKIIGKEIIFTSKGKDAETKLEYAFVVGDEIKIEE